MVFVILYSSNTLAFSASLAIKCVLKARCSSAMVKSHLDCRLSVLTDEYSMTTYQRELVISLTPFIRQNVNKIKTPGGDGCRSAIAFSFIFVDNLEFIVMTITKYILIVLTFGRNDEATDCARQRVTPKYRKRHTKKNRLIILLICSCKVRAFYLHDDVHVMPVESELR